MSQKCPVHGRQTALQLSARSRHQLPPLTTQPGVRGFRSIRGSGGSSAAGAGGAASSGMSNTCSPSGGGSGSGGASSSRAVPHLSAYWKRFFRRRRRALFHCGPDGISPAIPCSSRSIRAASAVRSPERDSSQRRSRQSSALCGGWSCNRAPQLSFAGLDAR